MKEASPFAVVLVTAPDLDTARMLAAAALESHLVACANLSTVESHFWWKEKLESADETLILFKTTVQRLPDLEKLILAKHPYDTPEFVVLALRAGNERYLKWIEQACSGNPL